MMPGCRREARLGKKLGKSRGGSSDSGAAS